MNRTGLLAAAALVAIPALASAAEYTVEPVQAGWITPPTEAATTTNPSGYTLILGPQQDGQVEQITLPFGFLAFGSLRNRVSVSDDGWLSFGVTNTVESENPVLPAERAEDARFARVAPLWDDLRTRGHGDIVTFVKGVAPARTFVVAWRHMDTAKRATRADVSFEVILHEGTGVLQIAYEDDGTWEGLSYTAGLQDPTGARAFGAPNLDATNTDAPASGWRFVPNEVDVTGTVRRERPLATETGLGPGVETVAVAGARVELVRLDTGESFASALTDENGDFTAVALAIDGSPSIGTVTHGDAVDTASPGFRKALNIQQAAQRGYAFVTAAAATSTGTRNFPQLEIRWAPNVSTASGYIAASSTTAARATISDSPPDPDPYDDDVILRTYASHVYATLSPLPTGTSSNSWTAATSSEQLGFLDGFAFWFACAVQGRQKFINTRNPALTPNDPTPAVVFDLELPTPAANGEPPSGAATAGAVAASLWELADAANEPRDDFDGTLPDHGYRVIVTLDQRKGATTMPSTAAPWTIGTFLPAFAAKSTAAEAAATARAFIADRTLPDDVSEPNDKLGEETAFSLPTGRMPGLVLNPYNEDRFSFTVGAEPLAVAASFAEMTEIEVEVLDSAGAVVATGTHGEEPSPVVCNVPTNLAQGTYTARVAWKSGPVAHYSLGIATRVALVTESLPAWTAGESFNATIETTGGIAPITFAVKPEVPEGLTLSAATGLLTGRPREPGTYPLEIVATDASGSGPQTIGTLQLVVNPALRLRDPIAVPANQTISVDVGTGGTNAQWTPSGTVPAGFTLTGGATLHLAGTTGAPLAFQVSGSATDDVGAVPPKSSTYVVVCAPVAQASGSAADPERPFGYWFDAIQGSRASFAFTFDGRREAPAVVVLDKAGAPLDAAGAIERHAGRVIVRDLAIPVSGRYFVVFTYGEGPNVAVRVTSARARVRPTLRVAGIANIDAPGARAEIRFHAIGGSRLKVVMRSGLAPVAAIPDFIEVEDPNGVRIEPLPAGRVSPNEARKVVAGIPLAVTGEYVVRVGARGNSTGALSYVAEITPPPGAPYTFGD